MKIGLICPELHGHLNPLTTLGLELKDRGHEVSLLAGPSARKTAERAGLEFISLGEDDPLAEEIVGELPKLGETAGLASMKQMGKIFAMQARFLVKHLEPIFQEREFDGLIIDQLSPGGVVVAERQGIPFVVACNALSVHWDPLTPPPPLPWDYQPGPLGRLRNWVAKKVLTAVYAGITEEETGGVDPLLLVFDFDHGLAQIAQQPGFFEFPRHYTPPHMHYAGPWHRLDRDDSTVDFPWDWLDDSRPLIYASMGTLQNRLGYVFDAIVQAVANLPVQMVLSKGGGDLRFSEPLPDHVLLVDRAPQLRLLERASYVITHAGLNTALECLAQGVPMLCLPVTNDQPGVAKRIEWLGAGRMIPVQKATAQKIAEELMFLMEDPGPQQVTNELRDRIAKEQGLARAADIVMQAFETKERVLREGLYGSLNPSHFRKSPPGDS